MLERRTVRFGLIAAPLVVRAGLIMPVRPIATGGILLEEARTNRLLYDLGYIPGDQLVVDYVNNEVRMNGAKLGTTEQILRKMSWRGEPVISERGLYIAQGMEIIAGEEEFTWGLSHA
jgi:hypothetical protein